MTFGWSASTSIEVADLQTLAKMSLWATLNPCQSAGSDLRPLTWQRGNKYKTCFKALILHLESMTAGGSDSSSLRFQSPSQRETLFFACMFSRVSCFGAESVEQNISGLRRPSRQKIDFCCLSTRAGAAIDHQPPRPNQKHKYSQLID